MSGPSGGAEKLALIGLASAGAGVAVALLGLAFQLFLRASAPRLAERLARAGRDAESVRGWGFGVTLTLGVLFLVTAEPLPPIGLGVLALFLGLAALGSHGLVRAIGARVLGQASPPRPLAELAAGSAALGLACGVPVLGWAFGVCALVCACGVGALAFAPAILRPETADLAAARLGQPADRIGSFVLGGAVALALAGVGALVLAAATGRLHGFWSELLDSLLLPAVGGGALLLVLEARERRASRARPADVAARDGRPRGLSAGGGAPVHDPGVST